MSQEKIVELEKIIGYQFQDKDLLLRALCHSSYSNENQLKKSQSNERLEFLGDAVLELISSEYLYQENSEMPEGDLTRIRASYVCEPTLALCARQMRLGEFILLGRGEEHTGGRERDSILSDTLEATIGAVYLDGGFEMAREYVFQHILKDIEQKALFYDSKTILQEIVQSRHLELSYELLGETGPDHAKVFTIAVVVDGKLLTQADGYTKKKAEQAAAYEAILMLQDNAG